MQGQIQRIFCGPIVPIPHVLIPLISRFMHKRENKCMLYAASMGVIWLSRVVTNAKSKNGEDNTKTSPTTAKT